MSVPSAPPALFTSSATPRPRSPSAASSAGDGVVRGDVENDCGAVDLVDERGQPLGAPGGGDDVPAVRRETSRGRLADAARGPGDDRDATAAGSRLVHARASEATASSQYSAAPSASTSSLKAAKGEWLSGAES